MLSSVLGFMSVSSATVVPYFAEYALGDVGLIGPLMGLSIVGVILGVLPTAYLARYFGKVQLIVWSSLIRFALGMCFYFYGFENLPLVFVVTFLVGILSGPGAVLFPVMIGDTIDHMEKQTGMRSEALAFATFTFSNKVSTGLAAWVAGIILAATGYIANQAQSQSAIDGIFSMIALFPAVSALISIVPLFFYSLEDEPKVAVA